MFLRDVQAKSGMVGNYGVWIGSVFPWSVEQRVISIYLQPTWSSFLSVFSSSTLLELFGQPEYSIAIENTKWGQLTTATQNKITGVEIL